MREERMKLHAAEGGHADAEVIPAGGLARRELIKRHVSSAYCAGNVITAASLTPRSYESAKDTHFRGGGGNRGGDRSRG